MAKIPEYLKGVEPLYNKNPHKAALEWFGNARYGLFLHYGLYSLLGTHEWAHDVWINSK
jgi:alpha-L-fucosidase